MMTRSREKGLLSGISSCFHDGNSEMHIDGGVNYSSKIVSTMEYQKGPKIPPKIPEQPNWPISSPRSEAITLSDLILPYQHGLAMERFEFGDIGLLCGVKGLIATVVLTAYQNKLSIGEAGTPNADGRQLSVLFS